MRRMMEHIVRALAEIHKARVELGEDLKLKVAERKLVSYLRELEGRNGRRSA